MIIGLSFRCSFLEGEDGFVDDSDGEVAVAEEHVSSRGEEYELYMQLCRGEETNFKKYVISFLIWKKDNIIKYFLKGHRQASVQILLWISSLPKNWPLQGRRNKFEPEAGCLS
jgi:hypothetical protein